MPNPSASSPLRQDRLDALRATWMLWMAGFHFCFDLAHFRWVDWNFYSDPFWTLQRTLILSGFLFFAGWGQGLALAGGQTAARFWRRWAQVAAAALLVSAGSAAMFPRSWISFGVLHAFVLLLPLLRFGVARWPSWGLLLLALAAALLPLALQHPVFDSRWLNWTGLVTRKPITEDFVPLLPWAAPMLLGLLASRHLSLQGGRPGAPRSVGGRNPGSRCDPKGVEPRRGAQPGLDAPVSGATPDSAPLGSQPCGPGRFAGSSGVAGSLLGPTQRLAGALFDPATRPGATRISAAHAPSPLVALLARLGRWPLSFYLLHQPLLLGLLLAGGWLLGH